jgi:cytochrome b involved in lipid metabolism
MKKYVSISLFVFLFIILAILTIGLIFYNQNGATNQKVTVTPTSITATSTSNSKITLTANEVAKHNSANNCWLIINGNIYNVTSYLNTHPAGPDAIIPYCGKDATQAFNTKGGRGETHSSQANNLLDNYLLGKLNQSASIK